MDIASNKASRKVLGLCAIIAIVFGVYWAQKNHTLTASNIENQQRETVVNDSKPQPAPSHLTQSKPAETPVKTILDISKPMTINGQSYVLMMPSEIEALNDWFKNKGYSPATDYENYSDDSLKEMAKNGDLKALEVLTTRAFDAGDEKAATLYMSMAVVHGSTTELASLTIYTKPRRGNEETEELRRPAALETLAVTKVAALRGDTRTFNVTQNSFIQSYKRNYDVDLVLTQEEQQFVDNRAQEIYNKFQEVRHAKGLGDFDNTEPTGVKKFFGLE